MLRFTLIPFILLFGGIIFSIVAYVIYRKIKRGVKYTVDKSVELTHQFQEKIREKEQRQQLPEIVQIGYDDFQMSEDSIKKLPEQWQKLLQPLQHKAQTLLDEISFYLLEDDNFERTKLLFLRSFFKHSLDALKQFSQKLLAEHKSLTVAETQKAKESIEVIYNDLIHHEHLLRKKRKFDFDVLMDVIKARLKVKK